MSSLAALTAIGVIGACAANTTDNPPANQDAGNNTTTDSGSNEATPDTGSPQTDSGSDTGSGNQGDSGPTCAAPATTAGDTLPFAIDTDGKFVPSGFEGDAVGATPTSGAITMPTKANDPSCNGDRASSTALGMCHTITYTPLARGTPIGYPPGATSGGWAAVVWQHPAQNWGKSPGYGIPAGATKVTFSAKGSQGGEVVSFLTGGIGKGSSTTTAPCQDTVSGSLSKQTLTTSWTKYTIALNGQTYSGGVIGGFGYAIATTDQKVPDGGAPGDAGATDAGGADAGPGAPVTFYIDDIKWE